ncbi:MAG: protein translocase subunit SecF [Bullifex sp.]
MNRLIKYRYLFLLPSLIIMAAGLVMFVTVGFNTGIDFSSGLSEEIQIAPVGMKVYYNGPDSAVLSVQSGTLRLTVRGSSGVAVTDFPASLYPTVRELADALSLVDGVTAQAVRGELETESVVSGAVFPVTLSPVASDVNFATSSVDVRTEDIRAALSALDGLNVQTSGEKNDGIFRIKVKVGEDETQQGLEQAILTSLTSLAPAEDIVILQSDFVGPKFSSSLLSSSLKAVVIAVALILIYIWIRFRFAYALSSILALVHDVLMMFAFILIFRLEVSSTTIAAVLTIIGYSLNNTIVIFDRVRENVLLLKGQDVGETIVLSIRESLTRTVITSLTTLFAVIPLAILSKGAIRLFAINLIWGVITGTYSSNFIAPSFLLTLHKVDPIDRVKEKKEEESYHIGDAYV